MRDLDDIVFVYPRVSNGVKEMAYKCITAIESVSELPSNVKIQVVPAPVIKVGGGETFGFGVFIVQEDSALIVLPGMYSVDMKEEMSRKEWLEEWPGILAHEWAHMEQWRDGKPLNHRGVENRTKKLLKLAGLN